MVSEFDPFAESVAGDAVAQLSGLNGDSNLGLSSARHDGFSLMDTFADLGLSNPPKKPARALCIIWRLLCI